MRTVVMKGRMKLEICNVLHVCRDNSGIIALSYYSQTVDVVFS